MSRSLRLVTILLALFYFAAATYHTGLVIPSGALPPASIAEALLGLVLVTAALSIIRRTLIAYIVVLAGTLFGFAIVLVRALLGIDLAIHVVMLTGLAVGFAVLLLGRRAPAP